MLTLPRARRSSGSATVSRCLSVALPLLMAHSRTRAFADVLTISIHQDRCFPPDSGFASSRGAGRGFGYKCAPLPSSSLTLWDAFALTAFGLTLLGPYSFNIPLPPGSGTDAYLYALKTLVQPALRRFKPDIIIVPSGASCRSSASARADSFGLTARSSSSTRRARRQHHGPARSAVDHGRRLCAHHARDDEGCARGDKRPPRLPSGRVRLLRPSGPATLELSLTRPFLLIRCSGYSPQYTPICIHRMCVDVFLLVRRSLGRF